jgi:hypothetical protein
MRPWTLLGLMALVGCSGGSATVGGSSGGSSSGASSSGATQPTEPAPQSPPATAFAGAASGCRDVFAFRASADGTQYVTVEVNRAELGLATGETRTIDLADAPPSVQVHVEVFARAPKEPKYCSDFVSETIASSTWTAEAGTLTLELGAAQGDTKTYKATARLTGLRLVGPERGTSAIVPTIEIKNVVVGWLPG